MSCIPALIEENRPLAPLTTLEVGGAARYYAETCDLEALCELCAWAREKGVSILPMGEGSNLLISDQGYSGLVLRWSRSGFTLLSQETDDRVLVRVEGGNVWDEWVAHAVAQDWAGIECLSGIPGCVGAAPIQNIGAYGQEVAETIASVEVVDRDNGMLRVFDNSQCSFSYRHSAFKGPWKDRYVVTAVVFRLHRGGRTDLRYGELTQLLGSDSHPSLAQVREGVLQLRRGKSMVRDLTDPNHRSAGSFFMNPVVADSSLPADMKGPRYAASPGQVKLSAAWLIENSGFPKGYLKGRAGLSTNHVLALTNRGGASSQEIVDLAAEIRRGVYAKFGIVLEPEAQFVGFSGLPPEWELTSRGH